MRAGDPVTVGRRDTTWPEYVWCNGRDGREGWVPEAFLEAAGDVQTPDGAKAASAVRTARRDYDALELDVAPGDVVLAGEEVGGWFWCETADGRSGWVPAECLAAQDAKEEQWSQT